MLSYKLTEIRLTNLRNPLYFIKKTNNFTIHSQQKLLTKRVREFILPLHRKLIAPAISETKS